MASDDSIKLDRSLGPDALLAKLREREDLQFRLVELSIDPKTGENIFGFNSTLDQPEPDAPDFLKLHALEDGLDEGKRIVEKAAFSAFGGGQIVADGIIKLEGKDTGVIIYRGPDPEFPKPHAPSLEPPKPSPLPDHAAGAFEGGGALAGIPLDQATRIKMSLHGLKDGVIHAFKNADGKIDAFVTLTKADIDTDGPGGSTAIDPDYQDETSLRFPNGRSCDSRTFPGVVRPRLLQSAPLGLRIGDFAYLYFKGKLVACQVYEQGPDGKIGEISFHAARQVGTIPADMSERHAATGGGLDAPELLTLWFPGSNPSKRAVSNDEIKARAESCLRAFTSRFSGQGQPPQGDLSKPFIADLVAGTVQPPHIFRRAAWGALEPKVSEFPKEPAQGIVIHNTQDANRAPEDGDNERETAFRLSRRIQHSHMFERGWSDVGQHFTVSRGGIIMEGRAGTLDAALRKMVVQGAHAGSAPHNRRWWGIEIEGDFREDPRAITPQQIDAVERLCTWLSTLIEGFDPEEHIKAHRQVKPGAGTDCPGKLLGLNQPGDFLTALRVAVHEGRQTLSRVA
jgi:hypothetical protein